MREGKTTAFEENSETTGELLKAMTVGMWIPIIPTYLLAKWRRFCLCSQLQVRRELRILVSFQFVSAYRVALVAIRRLFNRAA